MLSVSVDGYPVVQGIQMQWGVDSLEWRPQQNTICIEYWRAWAMHRQIADRETQLAVQEGAQLELLHWCSNYLNQHEGHGAQQSDDSRYPRHGIQHSDDD